MDTFMNMDISFKTIFPLVMALVLIFLVPVMASRQGMSYGEYILSLFTGKKRQYELVRDAMDKAGMKEIPLEIKGVFTSRNAVINNPDSRKDVMTVKGLLDHLCENIKDEEQKFDPNTVARQIKSLVKEIKSSKKR